MRTCISRNSSLSAVPKAPSSMARARWCIWTGPIIVRALLLPRPRALRSRLLRSQGRKARASRDGAEGGGDAASGTPREAARVTGRISRSARGKSERSESRKRSRTKRLPARPWPMRREAPRASEKAGLRANSAKDRAAEAAVADAAAGPASALSACRVSWKPGVSQARRAPSLATASRRGTTTRIKTHPGKPARTGKTETRARAGRGLRRRSPAKRPSVRVATPSPCSARSPRRGRSRLLRLQQAPQRRRPSNPQSPRVGAGGGDDIKEEAPIGRFLLISIAYLHRRRHCPGALAAATSQDVEGLPVVSCHVVAAFERQSGNVWQGHGWRGLPA